MSYIDIAIIVLVALGAIIGLWKGFFKTIISFFGWLVSFVIAFFLTKVVAEALLDVAAINKLILGQSGSLFSWVSSILPESVSNPTGVWAAIIEPLLKIANGNGGDVTTSVTLLVTNGMYSVIVCLALFIAIRIVMLLFTMFANAMTANKTIGALNRLFGFIVGAAKGFGTVCILFVIMSFFMGMSFMSPVRQALDKSIIGAPVSKKVFQLTDYLVKSDNDLLDRLFDKAGIKKDGGENADLAAKQAQIDLIKANATALNTMLNGVSEDIATNNTAITALKQYVGNIATGLEGETMTNALLATDTAQLTTIADLFDSTKTFGLATANYITAITALEPDAEAVVSSLAALKTEAASLSAYSAILGDLVLESAPAPEVVPEVVPEIVPEVVPTATSIKANVSKIDILAKYECALMF